MNEVDILDSLGMSSAVREEIRFFVHTVLRKLHVNNWQMGVFITDNEEIRHYNCQWRNVDAATDVLSFVQCEGHSIPQVEGMPFEAGDIIVSLQRVKQQALRLQRKPEEELRRVIIHGILHLDGMDHPGDDYEGEMLKIQERFVSETRSLTLT